MFLMQMGMGIEGPLGSAKRPLGDCLEGLVQMLSPLFVQRTYRAGSFLVKQVANSSDYLTRVVMIVMHRLLLQTFPEALLPGIPGCGL